MRKIKFRAWIKKDKQMVDVSSIEFDGCGFPEAKSKHFLYEICYRKNNTEYVFEGSEDVVLLQYTGIKDKDGEELYFDYYINVYFGNKYHSTVPIRDIYELSDLLQLINKHGANFKIYGNLYENPEIVIA